jgi:hypothetical protein
MLGMEGAETFREAGGNSSYGRHEQGHISTRSIGRYRKVLSPREIAFVQWFAGRQMAAYGYEHDQVALAPRERIAFTLIDWPSNLVRMAAWHVLEAIQSRTGRAPSAHTIVGEAPAM